MYFFCFSVLRVFVLFSDQTLVGGEKKHVCAVQQTYVEIKRALSRLGLNFFGGKSCLPSHLLSLLLLCFWSWLWLWQVSDQAGVEAEQGHSAAALHYRHPAQAAAGRPLARLRQPRLRRRGLYIYLRDVYRCFCFTAPASWQ